LHRVELFRLQQRRQLVELGLKAGVALEQLTEGTGGKIYPIEGDIKAAVKEICDEVRNDRYQLTYSPEGISPINKRRILVSSTDQTIRLRFKGWHPPAKQ